MFSKNLLLFYCKAVKLNLVKKIFIKYKFFSWKCKFCTTKLIIVCVSDKF